MSLQLETETHNGRASVIQVMDGAPYKSVAVTCVGGTCAYVLLDTGATTSFIRSELARILKDKPGMRPYDGHLQTAVRQGIDFDGRITANLTIGEIDNIFEALVVPGSKNQMIPGLRPLKEYIFCLDFGYDWTDRWIYGSGAVCDT